MRKTSKTTPADPATVRAAAAVRARFEPKAKPAAAKVRAGETVVTVGPYGTEVQARQDCAQFMHPDVFAYRSALFPLPQNYGVRVTMVSAEAVNEPGTNPMTPFRIRLTMRVEGPSEKTKNWIQSLQRRARGMA